MKIVIDIPEEMISYINKNEFDAISEAVYGSMAIFAIQNGTPLPEHHGRLIDADYLVDNLDKYIQVARYYDKEDNLITHIITKIDDVPTIIEADRGE